MSEHSAAKDVVRRDCPSCGGYMFKSVAGVWRHWPGALQDDGRFPENSCPIECPIPPGKD